jgi:hypothetical protein
MSGMEIRVWYEGGGGRPKGFARREGGWGERRFVLSHEQRESEGALPASGRNAPASPVGKPAPHCRAAAEQT